LEKVLEKHPSASLADIQRSHPTLRAMSLDYLALRVSRIVDSRYVASLK
jgi:hypothetical protein